MRKPPKLFTLTSVLPHLRRSLIALSFGVLATQSQAQSGDDIFEAYFKDWYQVEVIIFERIERQGGDSESWPKNLSLSYPDKLKFLMSQDTLKQQEALLEEEELSAEPLSAEASAENRRLLEQLKQGGNQDPYYQKLISSIEKSEVERLTPKEVPYIELDRDLRQLNDDATRIDRNRSMSVLFHQAWRQPIGDKENASAIVIRGGEQFNDHFELEGNIDLFVSRYLHAQTNLWLSEFEANFGQATEHWPLLPPPPWATSANPELNEDGTVKINQFNTNTLETDVPSWDINMQRQDDFSLRDQTRDPLMENFGDLAAKPFVLKQVITMRQKRRMRSGELHYIDHPKLGILLRIDKYEPKFNAN